MRFKEAMLSITIFLMICFLWFIPLVSLSGGTAAFLSALKGRSDVAYDSIFFGNLVSKINNHLVRMWRYFVWAYFLGIIPLIYYIGKFFYLPNFVNNKRAQFFAVWIWPTIIYNIFIQFGEIGHGMSWGLGFLLILGESIVVFCEDISQALHNRYWKGAVYASVLTPIILFNFFMFFYDFDKDRIDFYSFERYRQFNYMDVNKNNDYLMSKIDFIKKNFDQEHSLILSSSTFSHQIMYHLPEAVVIQANIIDRKDKYGFFYFGHFKRLYYKDRRDFIIPEGITKLVLFDEIFIPYLQNKAKSTFFKVGDNYKLLVYGVSARQKLVFDYHSIRID